MDQLADLQVIAPDLWMNPTAWLREKRLSREFWVFFTAAFFFDFGFSVYYFLFNLYLLDLHVNERAIGLIGGALTLGSLTGTLPAGFLARKFGLRALLIVCFIAAPLTSALRTMTIWPGAQAFLAFAAGVSMSLWGVCFLPAVARSTTEANRASAFSLIFSVSIGTSTLGGLLCGYMPRWLSAAGVTMEPAHLKRAILLGSCALAAGGLVSILRMARPSAETDTSHDTQGDAAGPTGWKITPFLLRFLPSMALWTAVVASFTPFANVYLSHERHVSLSSIGLIYSATQILQFCAGLLTPALFRKLGLVNGIVATQLVCGVTLGWLASAQRYEFAIMLYIGFSAMQWMSSPGLYNLLMSSVPETERSTASAMTMFCNALVGSVATAGSGVLFARFGYPHVLVGIAAVAVISGILFYSLIKSPKM